MKPSQRITVTLTFIISTCIAVAAQTTQPRQTTVVQGDHIVKDFKFKSGETLPELKLHYRTIGTPTKDANGVTSNAVLIMHGTDDKATVCEGSQFFYDTVGSKDKTLKLYKEHYHDLLNDIGKEAVMADIVGWIDKRIPAA
jgi:alpha-beta hydrolase superfamily lysophospholipase